MNSGSAAALAPDFDSRSHLLTSITENSTLCKVLSQRGPDFEYLLLFDRLPHRKIENGRAAGSDEHLCAGGGCDHLADAVHNDGSHRTLLHQENHPGKIRTCKFQHILWLVLSVTRFSQLHKLATVTSLFCWSAPFCCCNRRTFEFVFMPPPPCIGKSGIQTHNCQ